MNTVVKADKLHAITRAQRGAPVKALVQTSPHKTTHSRLAKTVTISGCLVTVTCHFYKVDPIEAKKKVSL